MKEEFLPMSFKLPGDWKLGTQIEADRMQDSDGSGMHTVAGIADHRK